MRWRRSACCLEPCEDPRSPRRAGRSAPVRALVLAGRASAYPATAITPWRLARLGLAYRPVSGGDIAEGALDGENLLVLPGGFSNWSLDAKEETEGADMAGARLLQGRLAQRSSPAAVPTTWRRAGRPGSASPMPARASRRTTCAPASASPPVGWQRSSCASACRPPSRSPISTARSSTRSAETAYRSRPSAISIATGHLFIDNPLTPETLRHAYGRSSSRCSRRKGARRARCCSRPYPEMGDLLVKYMALEATCPATCRSAASR